MASYYYLVSSLPMLKSDSPMPFSYEKYVELCSGNVSEGKLELIRNLTVSSTEGPLIREWSEFYGLLSKEMSYQRNLRLGKSAESPVDHEEVVTRTVQAAINCDDPLEAEQMLLDLEFKKLDELIGLHSFDDYSLFGYALKLKLLARLNIFDRTKGQAEFDRLFNGLQTQILGAK